MAKIPTNSSVVQDENKRKINMCDALDALPIKKDFSELFQLSIKTGQKFGFRLTIKKEIERHQYIQYSWLIFSDRGLGTTMKDKWDDWTNRQVTKKVNVALTVKVSIDDNGNIKVSPSFTAMGFYTGGNMGTKIFH